MLHSCMHTQYVWFEKIVWPFVALSCLASPNRMVSLPGQSHCLTIPSMLTEPAMLAAPAILDSWWWQGAKPKWGKEREWSVGQIWIFMNNWWISSQPCSPPQSFLTLTSLQCLGLSEESQFIIFIVFQYLSTLLWPGNFTTSIFYYQH